MNNEQYMSYLTSLKVGDTVYPCYDCTMSKATKCEVVNAYYEHTENSPSLKLVLIVKGSLWGDDTNTVKEYKFIDGECVTVYEEDSPTLMQMLYGDEDGDYYKLYNIEESKHFLNSTYLNSLGISD